MAELYQCLMGLILLLFAFLMFGQAVDRIVQLNTNFLEKAVLGFFVYFGLFQLIALPMVLTKQPLHRLISVWLPLVGVLAVFSIGLTVLSWSRGRKKAKQTGTGKVSQKRNTRERSTDLAMLLVTAVLTGGQVCFAALQKYIGWDTVFYIGTINDAVTTDTMYLHDGNTGLPVKSLSLRYALSTFYMHTAVICKKYNISPLLVQKYVIGTVCILLTSILLYLLGKSFWKKTWKACLFTDLVIVLTFFFQTIYTNAQFLLFRAYEAKAFCANVQMLAILYGMRLLWMEKERRKTWIYLFIVCAASVPISMSSILIVPLMVGIFLLTRLLLYREWDVIWKGALCLLPNIVYLILYFCGTKGWLVISV